MVSKLLLMTMYASTLLTLISFAQRACHHERFSSQTSAVSDHTTSQLHPHLLSTDTAPLCSRSLDGDILGELKKMASFSGSDQDKPKVESVTPVPPVLVARTAPAEAVAEARAAKPVRVAKPVPVRVVAEAASAKAAPVAGATS